MRCGLPGALLLAACLSGLIVLPVQAQPRRFALVVGVREYPVSEKLTSLAFTEPDADQLAATLRQHDYQVTLMTQTISKGANQERFNPSAALVRKQFRDLVGEPFLKKEDCLLVILEGHGIQLPSRDKAENLTYYFCPADAQIDDLKFSEEVQPQHNLIPVQELYDTLQKSTAGVKLLVVDACRNDPNKADNFRSGNSVTRPPVPEPPGGTAALFSCSANQRAAEDPDLKHGVFSYFLIEALTGKADLDGDGQLNIPELYNYVGQRTYSHVRQKYSVQQLPEFKGEIRGWAPLFSISEIQFAGTKAGDLWDKNSLQLKFRWCPPGSFKMGSSKSDIDAVLRIDPSWNREFFESESQVNVTLTNGFWLGQHEVTQGAWEAVLGTTPWKGKPDIQEGDSYPATYVNTDDASAFCEKLTAKGQKENWLPKGWKFDLPTEAQWEYACRAGTENLFSFGNDVSRLGQYAWFEQTARSVDEKYPHQTGLKQANGWGLHDMHGNVWEWSRDEYAIKLPGGIDPAVSGKNVARTTRGGDWESDGVSCRSASRMPYYPGARNNAMGFRVALVQIR